ncbi:GumC family protein [Chitinivibrio alkaliphilus]|uniref:non-specific protein-tyrosine kinase n=1 Tax=Chitinivibrio alkaliphilus ACht1 TaxID=1313304 RepID=U7DAH7_9BACT|nr:polysaccharide biosynthesis tyrosine autokinase [Chitinivibrio alkaliphilus]ERP31395.1 lipopolysaccharide biosynthesis protein [Chitinivibrio alkaliphilus ACht1]
MELHEYWHLIVRRRMILILSTILCTAVGLTYIYYATPVYEAAGKVLITDAPAEIGLGGSARSRDLMLSAIGSRSDPLMTQIEIMQTRPLLDEVIEKLHLVDDSGQALTARALRSRFSFSVQPNTNVIRLSCRHPEPEVAAVLINTLADAYIRVNGEMNRQRARAAKEFIEEQLHTQKMILDSTEAALVAYKGDIGSISPDQETQLRIGGIAQLETDLMRLESKRIGARAERRDLQEKLEQPGARNSSLFSHWRSALERVNTEIASIEAQKGSLEAKIAARRRELSSLPAQEIKYANLLRDREIQKNHYVQLLSQYEDFRIQEAANISTVKVVEPAIAPDFPVEPNKKKLVVLAVLGGLMVGFGLALIREYLDDTPRSLEEIRELLPYDFLGAVPYMKKHTPLYSCSSDQAFAAESIRLVQTNLKFSGVLSDEHNMLMVTSSQPGEGKTTTTINLGVTYAELGKKCVVVNLDLRRPAFHTILGRTFEKGLTDYLVGDASVEDIVYTHDVEHLHIIPSGTTPPNPSVLLANSHMNDLMDRLRAEYDMVLFDTPPVTMVAETLSLAPSMNGIVLVVDSEHSSVRMLKQMSAVLDGKNLSILGFMVNKAERGKRNGYYSSYTQES